MKILLILGSVLAFACHVVSSEKSKNHFDYELVCKGGIKVVLTELFGSISCFADAFGVKFDEVKGKYPPRMSKCMPPSLLKTKALSSPKNFKKWLCDKERPDQEFDKIGDCIANITDKEDQLMHDCYVELAGNTIREEVCVNKNQRELAWQFEEFKCLRDTHKSNFTCWTETFDSGELPRDTKDFAQWLCKDDFTPVALVHAYEVCTFAVSVEQEDTFFKCLHESSRKFL